MGKTSSMKGYQKKTSRAAASAQRGILKGKHGGLTIQDLINEFQQAGQGAEKLFQPIKDQAMADFQQTTAPQIFGEFGRESGAGSSALNQALAAARVNLSRQLASDFAGFQNNLASGIVGQKYQNVGQLAQLSQQGAFQNPYRQKPSGTSGMGGALLGGGLGALGSYAGTEAGASTLAGLFGGGAAATGGGAAAALPAVAAASSREVKDNIRNYEKGLEIVRELDVKQYDYTIPVEGRQDNRVGLIAEDVPGELQAMIGAIKGVDIYGLVSLLVNCVKQLDTKVKMLEAR